MRVSGHQQQRKEQAGCIEFVPKQELDRAEQQIEKQQREMERLQHAAPQAFHTDSRNRVSFSVVSRLDSAAALIISTAAWLRRSSIAAVAMQFGSAPAKPEVFTLR